MPINDIDEINCWENIEMALLKLDDDQFNILLRDKQIKTEVKQRQIKNNVKATSKSKAREDLAPISKIEDPFILELEKMFESGEKDSVKDILSSYNEKGK